MLFAQPSTHFLAVATTPPAHGIPVLVWLVLALNVAVVGFFIYRIIGLLRERGGASPGEPPSDSGRSENPEG